MPNLEWGQTWPSLEEFTELAHDRRVLPVVRKLLVDDVTPVSVYRNLAKGLPGTFVLESAESDGTWGRYSFVGVHSPATLTLADGKALWTGEVPKDLADTGNPIDLLAQILDALATPKTEGLPPLTGGLVGSLGWDVVRFWEPTLPATSPTELDVPPITLALAQDLVVIDHAESAVWLISNAINWDNQPERVEEAWKHAVDRIDQMHGELLQPVVAHPMAVDPDAQAPQLRARWAAEDFQEAVRTAKQAIVDGEVFQVVLSQRADLDYAGDPFEVYRVLRTINPSPYMYYVRLADAAGKEFSVVGSSPETLVKVQDREVTTFPIAGSRPRGATVEEDHKLVEELLADPKELSEHLMLVDLSRNDLAKVCEPESVEVVDFMEIKKYSHIMHICSTVNGKLRREASAVDTLKATFPAGTLSGAPKPRAVALIDELEPARRGIYGGTIGYFDFAGNMDMAIAIRTALIKDGVASVQAGAGIVADSVPETEFAESYNKAQAAVRAVQLAAKLHKGQPR